MNKKILKNFQQIATPIGFEAKKGKDMQKILVISDASIIIEGEKIEFVGKTEEMHKLYNEKDYQVIDMTGKTAIPGFVDSHTHFIFGGYRADEFGMRLRGKSYMEIMNAGGGIISSVKDTREASLEELTEAGKKRLLSMLSFGVTSVEGKSGYGLDKETELKQLRAMKNLDGLTPIEISKTFLGAHAVPKDYVGREDEFIDYMIEEVLPIVKEENLAEFCDVFCEEKVFDIEQSKRLLTAAKNKGFKIKMHADEIVPIGGSKLAVDMKAISADHLLQITDEHIKLMANSNTIATLLPGTAYSLKEDFADARKLIDSGCAVALATDLNPGSCYTESIPLIISLAALYMNMMPEEILTALTLNGAAAIDRASEIGSLEKGKQADINVIDAPSYEFLTYHIAVNSIEKVFKKGKLAYERRDYINV
ncbi:imidazolonepropionase [Geotoga petraea]|uniref:Imidazolonepropionase n=1 Tax=Geotoga petraea TaxID=28234 RepID=A0A1G6L931_9BACT|nr:imidazolonepropionase [Geotoga petraea]TGG88860.1 imidazolonepropionase [Geotoga petraea]SDC39046.1 imidazolonepropionase [Geotoga petraea]